MVDDTKQNRYEETGTIAPLQFIQVGKLSGVPAPLARISTCGGLTLDVFEEVVCTDPPRARYRRFVPKQGPVGTSTALALLQILVSLPRCYATRDWLAEHVGSSYQKEKWSGNMAMVRLDNVVSTLRTLLCPPNIAGEATLRKVLVSLVENTRESGIGYRLASSPLIWLDVEELALLVQQAVQTELHGLDALSYWEQAYHLVARGEYLPDEPQSSWIQKKRLEVHVYVRQTVQALYRLYLAQPGKTGEEQALFLLRTYMQAHPTDEDMLYPLLKHLAERGCLQEAEVYYHHFTRQGRTATARIQHVLQDMRAEHYRSSSGRETQREPASSSSVRSLDVSLQNKETESDQRIKSESKPPKQEWYVQGEQILAHIAQWQQEHPTASVAQIEEVINTSFQQLRIQTIEALVHECAVPQSKAQNGGADTCGNPSSTQ